MKMVKSLVLGSAAGLVAMSGAQAADLPVKAKAVEYVRICSLYGAGFYYIPGTDTCIKLGGYMRADMGVNTNNVYYGNYSTTSSSPGGLGNRFTNAYIWRARGDLNIDTRTATEYGVVRTFFDAVFTWTDDSYTASSNAGLGSSYSNLGASGASSGATIVNAGNATS
ncbi:MAG: porin, partial [Bradyrhizobium sp.]|nr:porin [Bradyrhizobium sp.]